MSPGVCWNFITGNSFIKVGRPINCSLASFRSEDRATMDAPLNFYLYS